MLEPNRVSIRDIPGWARESWNLLWRRPFLFFSTSILYHLLALSIRSIPYFSVLFAILLCYIFLLLLISFAESADQSKRINFIPTYIMIRKVILSLLLLTTIYICIYILGFIIMTMLSTDIPMVDYSKRTLYITFKWMWPGEMSFIILFMGILATSMWFLPPLLSLHDLNIRDSRALAKRADEKNTLVILLGGNMPFLLFIALMMITEISLILSLLVVPFVAIYQYVSYRHIFLGRKQNAPAIAKASSIETVKTATN